jgi:DAPG hydrolase PhiG domain
MYKGKTRSGKEGLSMTAQQPVQEGYYKTEQGGWEIIANHEISGVTPEMIDWWWDHIDSTERYKLWHPTDHHSFEWLIPPTTGHVGAVQRVEESFGDVSAPPIEIRWEDANGAAAEYDHVLLASSTMVGVPAADLMHEYEKASFGTRLCSHFHFPPGAPEELIKALYQQNREEMRNFSTFLPALYRSEMGGS